VLGFADQTWHETSMGRMEPDLFGTDPPPC